MNFTKMRIGDSLMLGNYTPFALSEYASDRPEPLVWHKADTIGHFVTARSIDRLCMDARHRSLPESPEWNSPDNILRRRGSGFFPESNLCQFLNSDSESWFFKVGSHQPPEYESHPGFLSMFTEEEKRALQPEYDLLVRIPTEHEVFDKGCSYFHRRMRTDVDGRVRAAYRYDLHGYMLLKNDFCDRRHITGPVPALSDSGGINTWYPSSAQLIRPMIRLRQDAELEPVPGMERTWRIKNAGEFKMPGDVDPFDPDALLKLFGLGMP